ncbi:hypothetical protein [Paraferrimonas sedimenticola]|uniref:hypothetical protein n=1 Tax=Paraferrimonas sedimenticola TaxID=375674 RepID=UPI001FEAA439|nr:hypothetical protein [Paraferrimonas sedimenticola]
MQFLREYKRASQSPWDDVSTVLLYCRHGTDDEGQRQFSFDRYIYQHRAGDGRILGISISKAILEAHDEFSGRYLEGDEMVLCLLVYIDEIRSFCGLFAQEFEAVFGLPPEPYFEVAQAYWLSLIEQL